MRMFVTVLVAGCALIAAAVGSAGGGSVAGSIGSSGQGPLDPVNHFLCGMTSQGISLVTTKSTGQLYGDPAKASRSYLDCDFKYPNGTFTGTPYIETGLPCNLFGVTANFSRLTVKHAHAKLECWDAS